MIPLIVIGAIVFVPILLGLLLRVNAIFIFMSICIGYFLQFALSDDVDLALATIIKGSNSIDIVRFVLLCAPILLTIFVLRKTAGRGMIFQLVPLLFSGLLLGAIALPLLSPGTEQAIYNSTYGGSIRGAQDLIIAAAVISNMLLMWNLFRHTSKRHGKHH